MKPTYEELEAKCQLQQSKLDAINELMGVIEGASDLAKDGIQNLEQQLSESRHEFTAANATIHNLELKVAQVVAENAVLKSKAAELVHEASEVYSAYNATITEPDGDFMDMQTLQEMQCVETPATDAYLAEVRAQGVDQFAKILEGAADTCGKAKAWDAQENLIDFAERATGFAAQLRQGAEHE